MIQCSTAEGSAEVCLGKHPWLGSPAVNMFPLQFLVLCLSDLYAFRVSLAPCVSAVGHRQQHICEGLLLVQVQKS